MAARIHKIRHDEETRQRIQASQLINRLTEHALGRCDMQPSAVTAALGLLKKRLPDLQATTIAGDPQNPLVSHIKREIIDAPDTDGPDIPAIAGARKI